MIEAAADLEAQGITLVDENFARGLFSRMEVYEESPIEAFNRMAKLAKLRQKSTDPNLSKLSAADKRVLKMLQAAYPKAGWTAKKYIESEKEG